MSGSGLFQILESGTTLKILLISTFIANQEKQRVLEVDRKRKFYFGRNRKWAESDVTHSAETVCATKSKAGLSAENRN